MDYFQPRALFNDMGSAEASAIARQWPLFRRPLEGEDQFLTMVLATIGGYSRRELFYRNTEELLAWVQATATADTTLSRAMEFVSKLQARIFEKLDQSDWSTAHKNGNTIEFMKMQLIVNCGYPPELFTPLDQLIPHRQDPVKHNERLRDPGAGASFLGFRTHQTDIHGPEFTFKAYSDVKRTEITGRWLKKR